MKRFYTDVTAEAVADGGGLSIRLDARPVRTPARALLVVPTHRLADAIVGEWQAQGDRIDPRTMPMTGLANAAIDRVAPDPASFAGILAPYAETDVLCYRAAEPPLLAEREAAAWDPLLAWARTRYDVAFEIASGIVHRPQPEATVRRLAVALAARGPFALAAMSPLVTIGGSLVTALALTEGVIDADAAFDATHLDEIWQAEQWGEDWMATDARDLRRADFVAAARFLELIAA
jgi:chaperone required for assembly of F1-ATPase